MMKVKDLRLGLKNVDVVAKVVKKGPPRDVFVKAAGEYHSVADILVGDETGTIVLSAWDDVIDQINEGDVIQITNGYVSEFGGRLQLNIGRSGQLIHLDSRSLDVNVPLEDTDRPSITSQRQFIKVIEFPQQRRGINAIVRIFDASPSREAVTKHDGRSHRIKVFQAGDETGCINLELWNRGDDILVGDNLEIRGGYLVEFGGTLSLNLSRGGNYKKSVEEIIEVNYLNNLSE